MNDRCAPPATYPKIRVHVRSVKSFRLYFCWLSWSQEAGLAPLITLSPASFQISFFQALLLEDKRPLDGYGTSGQPNGALIQWPFEAKNQLYYDRAGLQLSETEKSEQVHVSFSSEHLYEMPDFV